MPPPRARVRFVVTADARALRLLLQSVEHLKSLRVLYAALVAGVAGLQQQQQQ